MAIGYYGVKLSGNVVKTPEGYLVFKNAVIARTGFYIYSGKELLADSITASELKDQGVEIDPEAEIKVYRSPKEVFSKRSIDSNQGKPVTDSHPNKMLNLETVAEHERGQVFNVREGKEPLDDGNFPLLGDIMVKDSGLIQKWEAGLRELSCGYNYHIVKCGETLCQVDIIGNHVAFVENGRAGQYARVNDSKSTTEKFTMAQKHNIALGEGIKIVADKSTAEQFGDFLSSLFGRAGGAMDEADKPKGEDADKHPEGCRCSDCKPGAKDAAKAADAKAADEKAKARDRKHKALDKLMDAADSAEEEQAASEDEDMDALKSMFAAKGKDAAENVEESEEESEATDEEADDEKNDEDDEENSEANDEDLSDNASTPITPDKRQQKDTPSATDAAYKAGAQQVLKALKPFVARMKNKALSGAFDTTDKIIKGTGWKGSASYGRVAGAAGKANDSAIANGRNQVEKQMADAEAVYAAARLKKLKRN